MTKVSDRRVALNVFSGVFVNFYRIILQLAMLPIMARLLGPVEMGLYILTIPMLDFVLLLTDAGLEDSLAREKSDESKAWSSAFWGLLVTSTLLAAALYGASFLAASLAHQPRLPEIILPLTSTLIMTALLVVPRAKILRDGRATIYVKAEMISLTISSGLGIYMAYNGYGVMAMVAQTVCLFFMRVVIIYAMVPFWPKREFNFASLASHWGVGGAIMGGRLLELFGRQLENSLAVRALGGFAFGALGYAIRISRFVSDSVGNSVWANFYYLLLKSGLHDIPMLHRRFSRMVALVLFPVTSLLALSLPTIFPLLLGDQWNMAIAPTMILLVTYPFGTISSLYSAIMYNTGRSHMSLIALTIVPGIIRITAIWLSLPYGIMGVAIAMSIVSVVQYMGMSLVFAPSVGNRRLVMFEIVLGPLFATIIAAGIFYSIYIYHHDLIGIAIGGGVAIVAYVLALFIFDRQHTLADVDVIKGLLQKKNAVT